MSRATPGCARVARALAGPRPLTPLAENRALQQTGAVELSALPRRGHVRLAAWGADGEDRGVVNERDRAAVQVRRDRDKRAGGRVDRLAGDVEARAALEHEVELLVAGAAAVAARDLVV